MSSEPQNMLLPNLVWWCSITSHTVMRKKTCLLSSRLRSQRGLIWSKHYSRYYIFCTADSSATKHVLMIHHHKPACLVKKKKKDKCMQDQGHNEGSNCHVYRNDLLNRRTFCYQTWYCGASSWAGVAFKKICLQFSRSRSQQGLIRSKYDIFTVLSELLIPLLPNLAW